VGPDCSGPIESLSNENFFTPSCKRSYRGAWRSILRETRFLLMEQIPATRESAQRLGLVTIERMIGALVWAVENQSQGVRILGVPDITEKRGG